MTLFRISLFSCVRFAGAVCRGSDLGNRLAREFIGALVEIVTGMTAHPMPVHGVAGHRGIEPPPQGHILDQLLFRRPSTLALPNTYSSPNFPPPKFGLRLAIAGAPPPV